MDDNRYPVFSSACRLFLGDMAAAAPTPAVAASLLRCRELCGLDRQLADRSRRLLCESRELLARLGADEAAGFVPSSGRF